MPGIWGDGPRGGIFGARIDPALQRELERRAAEKRNEIERSTLGGRAKQWWDKSTFFKPAYEELVGGLTAPGDVMSGAQPTMVADPQTGEFHTAPELMDRVGALAGAMTLGSGAIPAEANALRMGIKAYHGSPHSFEQFDASKIGTGEGAQAYGHGLYFAEREGVAKEYRKKLTAGRYKTSSGEALSQGDLFQELMKAADQVKQGGSPENRFALHPDHRRSTVNRLIDGIEEYGSVDKYLENYGFSPGFEELQGTVINRAKELGLKSDKGSMYEVDIAAEPEQFLDWDRPLSEQSPKVRNILSRIDEEAAPAMSGADFYSDLARSRQRDVSPGNAPLASPQQKKGWVPLASQALREAGIPGIRYLDQGSRDPAKMKELADDLAQYREAAKHWAETGDTAKLAIAQKQIEVLEKRIAETRNYVIFPGNEHLISVLKKYGLPISAAGLAALHELHPQEAIAAERKDKRK